MHKTNNSTHTGWSRMWCLLLVLLANIAYGQQGSWGNIGVLSGGRVTVFGAHSFGLGTGAQPGIIVTDRFGANGPGVVIFGQNATYTGDADDKHVDGYLTKAANTVTTFDFPVGNGTKIRKIGIATPAAAGQFRAAYWGTNPNTAAAGTTGPTGAPFPVVNLGTGVTGVSTMEFWELTGVSSVDVKLTWTATNNPGALAGGSTANLIVVGYSKATNKWEKIGAATTPTGTFSGSGSVTATGVIPDNYSAFTFGTSAAPKPDLVPLVTMNSRAFKVSSELVKPMTLRIGNLTVGAPSSGTVNVYLSVGNTFTVALNGTSSWVLTDLGFGDYQLSSSAPIAAGSPASIPLNVTVKTTASKGNYNLTTTIDDNAGGETNNANNNLTTTVSVSIDPTP